MPPDAAGDAVADAPRGFDGVVEARADTATDVAPPCTMGLVTLATGDQVGSLALDADNVYFGTDKDVMRVSKCGGPPTVLASDVGPIAIAVDATSVYFTSFGSLAKVAITGGTITNLATLPQGTYIGTSAWGVAVDATRVYFSTFVQTEGGPPYDATSILSVPIGGGTPVTLATAKDRVDDSALAVDATSLYVTGMGRLGGLGSIDSIPVGGGTVQTLASGRSDPFAIARSGSSVYWTEVNSTRAPDGGPVFGNVMDVPIGGGTPATLFAAPPHEVASIIPLAVAADDASVYFTNSNDPEASPANTGSVVKVPVLGGAPVTLAVGQQFPNAIAVDDTSVYWSATMGATETSNGVIQKLTPK
jgi:hypothetical protein